MAEMIDNVVVGNGAVGDVKCRTGMVLEGAPSGDFENVTSNRSPTGGDSAERKKRTRRRKPKRKNPYSKGAEGRGKKNMRMRIRAGKAVYEQPVAPYNSNQFLIEDHNDLKDFDTKLMAAANRLGEQAEAPRTGRVRDASFTSAESDEDFFYSSPEDEEEFLTKEFSNTYQDLHVESLTAMSKPELIQTILQLEERVEALQKRLESGKSPSERSAQYQTEMSILLLANQKLANENARLRADGPKSSEDSESDSSTSSESTTSDDSSQPYMNGHAENDINMDPTDNT